MTSRQELIRDIIEVYIKNHKKDYDATVKLVKEKRKELKNPDLGMMTGGKMRQSFAFPPGLFNTFEQVFGYEEGERFLEYPGEAKWIAKKYPQFLIPYEY